MALNLPLTASIRTGIRHQGCAGALVAGRRLLFVTGEAGGAGGRPTLVALATGGEPLWSDSFPEDPGGIAMGAEPRALDLGGRIAVGHFVAHREGGGPGLFRVLDALTGEEIWRTESGSWYGGSRDMHVADLDGDGEPEVLLSFADRLVCCRASDGTVKWTRAERIRVCWGRSAIGDIDGDGKLEIVLGTEYANPDGTSSLLALRGDGSPLWEVAGIEGDCGSTPTFLVDVDGDGHPEILHTEIDLEGRGPLPVASLWCLRADGSLLWRTELGARDIAVGDINGDGVPEAVGVTDARDGGRGVAPSVRCVRLNDGDPLWQIPLERHWLSGWPLLADLDGDGIPEAVLPHGSPSGYGGQPGAPPWGEVLIAGGNGRAMGRLEYSDWVLSPLAFDWDGDGLAELIVPCGDGVLYVYG